MTLVLLGSSHSIGGWDQTQSKLYIHDLIKKHLGCEVLNLALAARGCEQFADAFVYACQYHKPSLFVVELISDRTFHNFYFPSEFTNNLAQSDLAVQYQHHFDRDHLGHSNGVYRYSTWRGAGEWAATAYDDGNIKLEPLVDILERFERSCVYLDDTSLLTLRTNRALHTLAGLSKLTGIPVVYWCYNQQSMQLARAFISQLSKSEYLNAHMGIDTVKDWAGNQLQGNHLADDSHLNMAANDLMISKLLVPFLRAVHTMKL